ncbi:hypothetical protein [Haloarcula halophila]|uniref:hypothetical protein n=1 Tax=Haloarcula TaxID=2237 RepID=UPI0023E3690B|nr:hypothetical protein [Halomicroarcula sp. DFY41]
MNREPTRFIETDEAALLELFEQAVTESDGFTTDATLSDGGTTKRSLRLHCESRQSRDGDHSCIGLFKILRT